MQHSTLPLVSIGIPTYHGAERIPKALRSVLSQPYRNVEVIISDNASTDRTEDVCRAFVHKDDRVRYFRQEKNLGVIPNFAYTLSQAKGKYFLWLSDDDELIPDVLERYVDFLEAHPDHALVSGKINYWKDGEFETQESGFTFEGDSALKRSLGYYAKVREGAMLYGMMRREMGQKVPFWPTLGSDWHFVAGLAFLGKLRTLDFVGYNKDKGGLSRDFKNYARVFGEASIWGHLPFVKIGLDAWKEFMFKNP
ncbi:MAG: glycosyltransferase family 2 protein, partial [Bacteroidota bacterium]